jgi:spore maturation protein CgeB
MPHAKAFMSSKLNIAFFGSSLVSAYWNGAATYYRGLIRCLAQRGHRITFYEPDAFERQQHRDMPDPDWAEVVVYQARNEGEVLQVVERARGTDLVVKASGVGVYDALLEAAVLDLQSSNTMVVFWDVDAPATLERIHKDSGDAFWKLIPRYDMVLTYGGGPPVVKAYVAAGARKCIPIYNALDPTTHHPMPPDARFEGDLGFLGNRLPDREKRVEEFFLRAASLLPHKTFIFGGNGWQDKSLPANVKYLGHVYTRDHNAFNCTPRAVLNVNRDSMARFGFSPPTRVFEAAGAGACLISDHWQGIEQFLEPDNEVLIAENGHDVVAHLEELTPERARSIGESAMRRVLAEHTYAHRAEQVEQVLSGATHPYELVP